MVLEIKKRGGGALSLPSSSSLSTFPKEDNLVKLKIALVC